MKKYNGNGCISLHTSIQRKATFDVFIEGRKNIMATIGFLRVSTLLQDTEKNKLDILQFANNKRLGNVEFVEETVSGTKDYKKRKLGALLERMTKGDILIVPELSRIARSTIQILEVIQITQDRGITLYSLKENFCNMPNMTVYIVRKKRGNKC